MPITNEMLETLSDKFGSVGKEIGEKAKDVAEAAKLRASIAAEEVKIKEHYYQIGRQYYEQFKDAPDAEFIGIVDNINAANERIAQYKEALKQKEA